MTEEDLVRLYRLGTAAGQPRTREGCVPPDALLAAVERRGTEEERARAINHAAACDACAEELELLRATSVVRDRARVPSTALAIAASVLLVAGLGYYTLARQHAVGLNDDLTRGAAEGVHLVSPTETATRLDTLVWHGVTGAANYVMELRSGDGRLLARASTGDTTFVVPDSVRITPGSVVYWTISARLTDGTELRSPARRVRLTP
jgi:hypothetical protein